MQSSCSIQNGEYKGSYLDLEFSLATSLKKIAKVNYQSMIYEHIAGIACFLKGLNNTQETLAGFPAACLTGLGTENQLVTPWELQQGC